jgi:hypothetical protein
MELDDTHRELIQVLHSLPCNLVRKPQTQTIIPFRVRNQADVVHRRLPQHDSHPLLRQCKVRPLQVAGTMRRVRRGAQTRVQLGKSFARPARSVAVYGTAEVLE